MKTAALLLLALAAGGASAAAIVQPGNWADFDAEWANSPEFETSKALCRAVRGREPPAADRPSPAQAAALAGCSSEALYYGIGTPADPVRARHCAFLEMEEEGGSPFAGPAMLMTVYANGRGARRDLDVALNLACQVDGAPAESHGRVTHLAELRASRWSGDDFHYCDDITSGISSGFCAGHRADIAGAEREAELARIAAALPAPAQRAFAALREAHGAYAEAHSESEVDLSGSGRGAFQVEAQERLQVVFLETVRAFESGRSPPAGASQLRSADAALNAAYREALRRDYGDGPGAVTADGVRRAQRAWLGYRDAFLAFAAVRRPSADRDSFAAMLTRQRTRILSNLPGD